MKENLNMGGKYSIGVFGKNLIGVDTKNLKLAEKGYNPNHECENQVTVIMAFSVKSWIPVAVDVFYGSVKDIKSLGYFIDRFHDRDMGFIMDRGLFSETIIVNAS